MFNIYLFSQTIVCAPENTKSHWSIIKFIDKVNQLPSIIDDGRVLYDAGKNRIAWFGHDADDMKCFKTFEGGKYYREWLMAYKDELTVTSLILILIRRSSTCFKNIPDPTEEMITLHKMLWEV